MGKAHHLCFTQRQIFEHPLSDRRIGDVDDERGEAWRIERFGALFDPGITMCSLSECLLSVRRKMRYQAAGPALGAVPALSG
jgi:hypothetical protein